MAYKYRGRALIIGNEFKDKELERKGCMEDLKMMSDLFTRLDFHCTMYRELTAEKFLEKITKASTDSMNVDSECFVLVISSHGVEVRDNDQWRQAIHCLNGMIYVDDIFNILKKSKSLAGKPKLLFLQICRNRDYPSHGEYEDLNQYNPSNQYDHGHYIPRDTEPCKPPSTYKGVQEINIAERLHKAIYECDVTNGCENIYCDIEADPEEWTFSNEAISRGYIDTSTTNTIPTIPRSGDQKHITGVDALPEDFLVQQEKFAFRVDKGSYMIQYMYKAENALVLLKGGGNILQYTTKVCKTMAESFELQGFALNEMPSIFHQKINILCKAENRYMLKRIRVNTNLEESCLAEELKEYFRGTFPLSDEFKLMTGLIKHVHGDVYSIDDNTLDHLLKYFHHWVKYFSDSNRDSVQQFLSSCNIKLPTNWNDHDLANCFKIICKLGEMKAILVQVYGKDSTLEDLLKNFQCLVKSLSEVQNKDSVQQYLSSRNITLREDWDDKDLANCFEIIRKLGEMKAILQQLFPFKAACCVYHRLRETVTFSPKSKRSKMARVREELKRHDL